MVGQLLAAREVEPVEDALQAFARKLRADAIAGEFRTEGERMDVDVARAAEFAVDRGDMKRRRRLILKFQMLDERLVAGEDFRDRVGEIRRIRRGDVAFHNGHAAVGPGHNQVARRHGGTGFTG